MLNRAEEDYIKIIYELTIQDETPKVKPNEISEYFGYTDQSVNEMIKKLSKKKYLEYIPYKGVSLTKKGHLEAIRMIRSHRIWEVFLTQKLNFSWEEVHQDAELLEHVTSESVLNRLYDYLGKPKTCQHGNPIPNQQGEILKVSTFKLLEAQLNQPFKLTRVLDYKDLLIFLNKENIKLGDIIVVEEIDEFTKLLKIKCRNQKITISTKIAKMLFGTHDI